MQSVNRRKREPQRSSTASAEPLTMKLSECVCVAQRSFLCFRMNAHTFKAEEHAEFHLGTAQGENQTQILTFGVDQWLSICTIYHVL